MTQLRGHLVFEETRLVAWRHLARSAVLLALGAALVACSDTGGSAGSASTSDSGDGIGTSDSGASTESTSIGSTGANTSGSTFGGTTTAGGTTSGVGTTGGGVGVGGNGGSTDGTTSTTTVGLTNGGGTGGSGGTGAGGSTSASATTTTGGGAGGSGGGAGGSGGSSAYSPCPVNGDPCKVMPLGDSITWGVGDEANGGYRGPLFEHVVTDGKNVTFTGSLSNGPAMVSGQSFPQRNEGHSGWGISRVTPYSGGNAGIATVIPSPGFDSGSGGVPHIILLHIGTNDEGSFTAQEMIGDLTGFLDQLIANAPDAYLLVAQIIPLGYGTNDKIRSYNEAIPGLVEERASAGKHIAYVDMFTEFNAGSMLDPDNVHPNPSGYQFMADTWYAAVRDLLPE